MWHVVSHLRTEGDGCGGSNPMDIASASIYQMQGLLDILPTIWSSNMDKLENHIKITKFFQESQVILIKIWVINFSVRRHQQFSQGQRFKPSGSQSSARGSNFDSGPKRAAPPGSALGTPPPKEIRLRSIEEVLFFVWFFWIEKSGAPKMKTWYIVLYRFVFAKMPTSCRVFKRILFLCLFCRAQNVNR